MNDRALKWQCRRGMRELDVLLSDFLENSYPAISSQQKAAFKRLLALSDPELNSYILHGVEPDDEDLARVVRQLRCTDRH